MYAVIINNNFRRKPAFFIAIFFSLFNTKLKINTFLRQIIIVCVVFYYTLHEIKFDLTPFKTLKLINLNKKGNASSFKHILSYLVYL